MWSSDEEIDDFDDYDNPYGDEYSDDEDEQVSYKDGQRTGKGTTNPELEGIKIYKTPEERLVQSVSLEYTRNLYNGFLESEKEQAIQNVNVKRSYYILFNPVYLAAASIFYVRYKALNKNNIAEFLKNTDNLNLKNTNVGILEFVRYLRMLEHQ